MVETKLLDGIKRDLLDPVVVSEVQRRVRALIRSNRRPDHTKRIQGLKAEADRLVEAIAQGLNSRTVTDRLRETETDLARLEAEQLKPTLDPELLVPALPKLYREKVRDLEKVAERNPEKARQAILEVIPEAIVLRPEDGHLVAEFGIVPVQLTGTDAGMYGSGGLLPIRATFYSLRLR